MSREEQAMELAKDWVENDPTIQTPEGLLYAAFFEGFKAADQNPDESVLELVRSVQGFRDHGVAKNGTHAEIMFKALSQWEARKAGRG